MSIHHIQLWVPDLTRATASWGWLLGELGYEELRRWKTGRVFDDGEARIIIEQSPDMVPGMLHSRLRPGLNHLAFRVDDTAALWRILERGPLNGWTSLDDHVRHPVSGDPTVVFLEDRDGFEVELVAPDATTAT